MQVLAGLLSSVVFLIGCIVCSILLVVNPEESPSNEGWSALNAETIRLAVTILIPLSGLITLWFGYSFVYSYLISYQRTVTSVKEYTAS